LCPDCGRQCWSKWNCPSGYVCENGFCKYPDSSSPTCCRNNDDCNSNGDADLNCDLESHTCYSIVPAPGSRWLGGSAPYCVSDLECGTFGICDWKTHTCKNPFAPSAAPSSALLGASWPECYSDLECLEKGAGTICDHLTFTCKYKLGAAKSEQNVAQLGETCACDTCGPDFVSIPCADGLVCFNKCNVEPGCVGGVSKCVYPPPPMLGSTGNHASNDVCTPGEVIVISKCLYKECYLVSPRGWEWIYKNPCQ